MGVITISSGSYSKGKEIAEKLLFAFFLNCCVREYMAKCTISVYLIFFSFAPQGCRIDTQNPSSLFD